LISTINGKVDPSTRDILEYSPEHSHSIREVMRHQVLMRIAMELTPAGDQRVVNDSIVAKLMLELKFYIENPTYNGARCL
jgi:hypothetical protein